MVVELGDRGVEVHRLDTQRFPTQLSLSARLRGGRWAGQLRTEHRTVELDTIDAVWYRSPKPYRFPAGLNEVELGHAKVEAKYGLAGVLMALPVLWVNHPARLADSAYKPVQLAAAARCGVRVPDTLITNEPDAVREFAGEARTVTKMLGAVSIVEDGIRKVARTEPVTEAHLADLRGVEHTAHQFQHWAAKRHEARMFVVGDQITTAAIHAHTAAAYIDWRDGYDTNTYELIEPPDAVRGAVLCMMRELGLVYGALDFVIGPDGEWTFLEVNAGGQYGWIEDATGAPITAQLADLLTKGPHQ
ncbi:ATP-grasp ribosomal peptide maturase [Amycolatopsis thermophila]|uniref:ATP-grasp ribosomal peptide maturase n=2 Tax=Amycolatopsis thermophila TaxID=206084 RepID=A0ABU0EMG2_9PSEU|nr:ATP-grasp ribosomal peptide maturase [Amycolatopsis thermophila]